MAERLSENDARAQAKGGDRVRRAGELPSATPRDRYRVAGQRIVNNEALFAAAVRSGAGPGPMMKHDVADEIADGRLVQMLDRWFPLIWDVAFTILTGVSPRALWALADMLRFHQA